EMGWPGLRNTLCALADRSNLSWHLGTGTLPVSLLTGAGRDRFAADNARMVSPGRGSECALPAQPSLVAPQSVHFLARPGRGRSADPSLPLRRPCFFHQFAFHACRPDETALSDGL